MNKSFIDETLDAIKHVKSRLESLREYNQFLMEVKDDIKPSHYIEEFNYLKEQISQYLYRADILISLHPELWYDNAQKSSV